MPALLACSSLMAHRSVCSHTNLGTRVHFSAQRTSDVDEVRVRRVVRRFIQATDLPRADDRRRAARDAGVSVDELRGHGAAVRPGRTEIHSCLNESGHGAEQRAGRGHEPDKFADHGDELPRIVHARTGYGSLGFAARRGTEPQEEPTPHSMFSIDCPLVPRVRTYASASRPNRRVC